MLTVRIELDKRGKQFDFEAPKELIGNLLWFLKLKNFKDADFLREI